ncbi:hypothetical protein [Lysinibacter sp. HNR]|uniref:hypothetical protein n=1 Tax=Lysinibacter sp. HNR TaxID=3031408 RepID=UPI00243533FA|nr:hypothetical protein [Lysinibacter sp. HNR]WGD37552.1 hypothetical protein FrondiHNR_01110 [Lysinibacter sp. HNR]
MSEMLENLVRKEDETTIGEQHFTVKEVATHFRTSSSFVLSRIHGEGGEVWPHKRLSSRLFVFTQRHIDAIDRLTDRWPDGLEQEQHQHRSAAQSIRFLLNQK